MPPALPADARPSPASRSSRSSRSSPYLTSKPLPLDGDEKMRLASWDFGDAVTSSPHELDKGKARAFDDADDYDLGEVERPTPAAPRWGGLPSLDDETLSDFGDTRSQSMPVLAGTSRLSIASDTSSMIAWAGPSLTSPPLVRPPLVGADTFASRYSVPYHLSPILESDTASDCHLGPVGLSASSPSTCAHEPTTTARPILHIDPPRRPTRMHSDMSMSVYSRQSIALPEREHDGAEAGELDWGEELLSYFSPDTPVAPSRPEPLEGLAIRGADTMPCPTPMSLEGEVVYDPLPTPSVPSQIVLSARPSFSAFAFPSTSSLARTASSSSSEQASYAASPLFDEVRASAALSTFTVATSVFDGAGDGQDGASTPEKDVQGVDGGVWRADWGWEPYRRSAEPEPVVEQGDSAGEPALSPRVLQQPLSSAPASPKRRTPSSTSPPTLTVDLAAARSSASSRAVSPVLLPLAARALRKREKSLPSIPDNASMWSGATGVPVPSGETMHVEVFCTRELVRCGKYGERRVVVERTLLFTEDA